MNDGADNIWPQPDYTSPAGLKNYRVAKRCSEDGFCFFSSHKYMTINILMKLVYDAGCGGAHDA